MPRTCRIMVQIYYDPKGVCSHDSQHLHPGVASTFFAHDFSGPWHAASLQNSKVLVILDLRDLAPVIAVMLK